MKRKDRPIGVFDSGLGGLTVVKEITRQLPHEDIIYFGDTARVPYGTKSKDTVERFSIENASFLSGFDVKLMVVACNTSSSLALPLLQKRFKMPIVGVIRPGAKAAVEATRNRRIGVIGTRATVKSGEYQRQIKKLDPAVVVKEVACPLFVPLVEEGWINDGVTRQVVVKYMIGLKGMRIDTLILGCTHYPLLSRLIQEVMGESVRLINSAREVALEVNNALDSEGLRTNSQARGKHRFYVSDEPERFAKVGRKFIGQEIDFVREA